MTRLRQICGLALMFASLLPSLTVVASPQTHQEDAPETYDDVMELALGTDRQPGDIDLFWREVFAPLVPLVQYQSPHILQSYDENADFESSCVDPGREQTMLRNAFYCPEDAAIRWDDAWLKTKFADVGTFAPLAIIAHEWGHHVQRLLDLQTSIGSDDTKQTLQRELQADCFAGFYMEDARVRGTFSQIEAEDGLYALFLAGNQGYSDSAWFNPDEHGLPTARSLASLAGGAVTAIRQLNRVVDTKVAIDLSYCLDYGNYTPQPPVNAGVFGINVLPGSDVTQQRPGFVEVVHPSATTRFISASNLIGALDDTQFATVRDSYFADLAFRGVETRLIDDPYDNGFVSGPAVSQIYEQTISIDGGSIQTIGVLTLHIAAGASGLLIDTFREGRESDVFGWNRLLPHENVQALGVCSPTDASILGCWYSELAWLGLPEFTFRVSRAGFTMPRQVESGRILVTAVNDGIDLRFGSLFVFVKLADGIDLPPQRTPAERPRSRFEATPSWFETATVIGGPALRVAGRSQVVVNLTPGRWAIVGYPYFAPVSPPFEVIESREARRSSEPRVRATIVATDDSFAGLDTRIVPGHQVWQLSNQGQRPHELQIVKFPDGVTRAQMEEWVHFDGSDEQSAELGFDPAALTYPITISAISPGQTIAVELYNLPPGTYGAFCYLPTTTPGANHADAGQVVRFTVGSSP